MEAVDQKNLTVREPQTFFGKTIRFEESTKCCTSDLRKNVAESLAECTTTDRAPKTLGDLGMH